MVSITLFHANWCGHCKEFLPTWGRIKGWCAQHGIKAEEFEDEKIQQLRTTVGRTANGVSFDDIEGYPTIIIMKDGKKINVDDRSESSIKRLLGGDVPLQSGGQMQNSGKYVDYEQKYLKYKRKYLNMKH